MDKIWAMTNLEEAFKEVKLNRGAAGLTKRYSNPNWRVT